MIQSRPKHSIGGGYTPVKAWPLEVAGKQVKQYPAGRVCCDCDTVLSIYTRGKRCWVHQSPEYRRIRRRVAKAA
jgi:hypothetical protein